MENMNMWLMIGLGIFATLGIIAYIVLMIFFPEWVGITGKVALENERSHALEDKDTEANIHTKKNNSP
jgi:uncharacterized membrane protein